LKKFKPEIINYDELKYPISPTGVLQNIRFPNNFIAKVSFKVSGVSKFRTMRDL